MPTGLEMRGPDHVADRLVAKFAGVLPEYTVRSEVGLAERELAGQVPEGALKELTHQLAVQRLRQRCDRP